MEAKKIIKSYKFKIRRPSKAVVAKLEETLLLCRELYNAALQERRDAWKLNRINVYLSEQEKQLPEIKKTNPEYKDVHSQVLQETLKRLDKTFQAFFDRVRRGEIAGYPRFKNGNRFNSFRYVQSGFSLTGDKVKLSKIGSFRIHLSRPIQGKVKTCTIQRQAGNWFVIFTVETLSEILPKTGKQIGVDVGIESFATLSNGEQIFNHKFFEANQRKLRKAQRRVSRRSKNSKRRQKAWHQVRKIYGKIQNQRNDFLHKISTELVKNYDLIAIENLNISGLAKSSLAKQIRDAAWGDFFLKLKYKAENAGKRLIEVNPSGTSQTCLCGTAVKKDLRTRWHNCGECGLSEHRDIVSAKIILNRAVGQTVKDLTRANTSGVSLESS